MTVLLAVHDGEPYVRDAVASVLAQTFSDFELLVVDDASDDDTVEIVESFADPRIRLLRNERNLGQVPSLNRGLREARGEIVARIDADDVSLPTRLERQVAVLDAEPEIGLVGCWLTLVDEHGRRVGALRKTLADFTDLVFHTLIMRVWVSHPAAAFRRDPVLALGGYDESTGPAEDKDLWRKLALERWDARIVPEELVRYRLHDAQLSQTRADYQRQVDGASQERFLAELAPDVPLHAVRLALAHDPGFWSDRRDVGELLRGLAALLAGARERLRLDDAEAARLERSVAGWLLPFARRRPWRAEAVALAAWGLNRVPPERRLVAATAQAAAFPLAPLALGVRRGSRALAAAPGIRRARRSHLARRVYARMLGGG